MMRSILHLVLATCVVIGTGILLGTQAVSNAPDFLSGSGDSIRYMDQIEKETFLVEEVSSEDFQKNEKLDGLQFDRLTKAELKSLSDQTAEFQRYSDDKMKIPEKARYLTDCLKNPNENFYCEFLVRSGTTIRLRQKSVSNRIHRKETAKAFRNAELDYLNDLSRRDLFRGLRYLRSWKEMQPTAKALLSEDKCRNTHLYTVVGVESESYFPEPENQKITKALFRKNIDCYLETDVAKTDYFKRVLFRHALFSIQKGECEIIQPHLEILGNEKGGDFVTRALYWNAHCAYEKNQMKKFEVLKARLMNANPLGYHNISLQKGQVLEILKLIESHRSPSFRFRSELSHQLNRAVRAAEMSLRMDAPELTAKILYRYKSRIFNSENRFQLYVAFLSFRANSPILSFQLLSRLFRRDPKLITKETLQIFYPLKYFKTLWAHRKKIDPYFAASLIRQESGFQADIRSPAGALGLMQLMPRTARSMAKVSRWQILKPKTNIRLGVRYLSKMLNRFGGDAELALAAYNAGPHNVEKWIRRYSMKNRMLFIDLMPFSETRNYVSLIARNYFWYTGLYSNKRISLQLNQGRSLASESDSIRFPSIQSIGVFPKALEKKSPE